MEFRRRRTMASLKDILRSNTRRKLRSFAATLLADSHSGHNSMAVIHLKRLPLHNRPITAMGNRLPRRNSMAVITRCGNTELDQHALLTRCPDSPTGATVWRISSSKPRRTSARRTSRTVP